MTICTSTTGTTDTMDVCLWIVWNMIVHDESDIVEVESARRDVSTDEDSDFTVLERLDRTNTISLHHISVDIGC
jgi:hypothetical protein